MKTTSSHRKGIADADALLFCIYAIKIIFIAKYRFRTYDIYSPDFKQETTIARAQSQAKY